MGIGLILGRTANATATIFLSFILSYVMLIGLGLIWPEGLNGLILFAERVEDWIESSYVPVRYGVWVRLLIEEGAILLLFFTLIARILIALVASSFMAAVNPKR
ncbi:hypothetical protein DDZ18_10760 [Marinicauda salina]|uniref:Uncharacterized protein n=1 Tax=Marinicauda salina TaxID=2135793 RepID=A0A2U2BRN9_9PROT|nr:hypothetical protein [Marinicauda salina]PWE16683.1 hypothetical protein DDZ18_10760 [Marinicauda salina]